MAAAGAEPSCNCARRTARHSAMSSAAGSVGRPGRPPRPGRCASSAAIAASAAIVRRAGLVRVVGRGHAQHGSGLGAEAERHHCARHGLPARAARKRRCRRGLGHLAPQTLLQQRLGLAGEIEPPRQAGRMRELIGDVRWRGQRDGHRQSRSPAASVAAPWCRRSASTATPCQVGSKRELRRAALRRNALAVPSLRADQQVAPVSGSAGSQQCLALRPAGPGGRRRLSPGWAAAPARAARP